MADGGKERMRHVVDYILSFINVQRGDKATASGSSYPGRWQSGCPNIIPGLRACPFWDRDEFPWLSDLEGNNVTVSHMSLGPLNISNIILIPT
jgi:hypothetical protein